jgi:hypothetical protein
MPALRDTLRNQTPEGYEQPDGYAPPGLPSPALPVPLPGQGNTVSVNVSARTSLPPINAGPDTLRQFNEASGVPARRVLPLPVGSTVGTGTVNNYTTATGSSSSSGSGSSSTSSLKSASVTLNTGLIYPTLYVAQVLSFSQSFQLLSISANAMCEVRLYGSSLAQTLDGSRVLDAPVPAEVTSNLIADVALDTAPYVWPFQNIIGANSDSPQSTNVYVSVFNISTSASSIQVTLTYVALET